MQLCAVCASSAAGNTFLEIPSAAWICFGVLLSPKDKDPPFASIAWSTFSTPSEILATAPSGRSETSTCVRVEGLGFRVYRFRDERYGSDRVRSRG